MLPYKLHVVMDTETVKQEPIVLNCVRLIMVFVFLGARENSYRRTKSRKGYSEGNVPL